MATHSSTLAWKIPWAEELGRLQSIRSLRLGHDWATSLHLTKRQEERNQCCNFSPSRYKFKRRLLWKLCCHDDSWLHLNLTFLKPWANQCVFLMEIFFLSYINELCICLEICLYSRFMSIALWPRMTHIVPMLSEKTCCGWGAWCNSLCFEALPFSN